MNIAIAGAGIAGGYLAKLLGQKGISTDIYDGMNHDTRLQVSLMRVGCAPWYRNRILRRWVSTSTITSSIPWRPMNFNGLAAETPLCTINKPRLIRDLTRDTGLKRQNLGPEEAEDYDVVVDATGISRAFLPPCRSDLVLPTLQHRVMVESHGSELLKAGVYGNRIPGLGYLWIFPLGKNQYHIGVGGVGLARPDRLLDRFYQDSAGAFFLHHALQLSRVVAGRIPVLFNTLLYHKNPERPDLPGDCRYRRIDRYRSTIHGRRYRSFP